MLNWKSIPKTIDAMDYNVSTITPSTVGISRVRVGRRSEMTTVAQLPAVPTTPEEEVTIADDHVFAASKGFSEVAFDDEKSKWVSESTGGRYSKGSKVSLTLFIPGKSPNLIAWLKNREDVIFLIEDADCDAAGALPIQLGSNCNKVTWEEINGDGLEANADDDAGWTVTISAKSGAPLLFYSGVITEPTP